MPDLQEAGLRGAQFIRATIVIDGRTAPAAWSLYRCPLCGGRLRQDVGSAMRVASDDEWRQFVDGPGR
jgi:hypothetical protein